MPSRLHVAAVVWMPLFSYAAAQEYPTACCYADGHMEYGFCGATLAGASSWLHFKTCWSQALRHFANTTIVGEFNLTMAEKYSIFVIMIDRNATKIQADPDDLPLTFDADIIPAGALPELGYLPFKLKVSLPYGSSVDDPCPVFQLSDISIRVTLHHQQPRTPGRHYAGFTFGIDGCSRQAQTVSNLEFHALGYGNLELSFLTLRDSANIVSIEPPSSADIDGPAGDALAFVEADVINSTLHYFGDVSGQAGNTFGLSQNGSRSIGSNFLVENPVPVVPDYSYRRTGDGYQFSWYGSYPQEWNCSQRDFKHIDTTSVEYIRDVQLGSVNISRSSFLPWLDISNPVFHGLGARSTANPPSIILYNMETGAVGEHRLTYGCNATNSVFQYMWDVNILASAVTHSILNWSAAGASIPASWTTTDPNPSFWVDLQTDDPDAGFVRGINDTLLCMRPAIHVNGTAVPEQSATVEKGSLVTRSPFLHTTDQACRRAQLWSTFDRTQPPSLDNTELLVF